MRYALSILLIFSLSGLLQAQETRPGFSMLSNAPTPFALGLNEASTSMPHGSGAIYINPALLSASESSSLDFAYSSWIDDTNFIFGGANFVNRNRSFSVGIYNSQIDGFQQRNNPGPSNGEFSVSYLSLSAAMAYDFNFLHVGVAGQYLNEDNFTYQANGYAFNFGIYSNFIENRLRAGISLLNIGDTEQLNNVSTKLPEEFRSGVSFDVFRFSPPKNDDLPILVTVATDFIAPLTSYEGVQAGDLNSESHFNFGILFDVAEVVQISGGYKTGDETAKPFSFGAGFKTEIVNVNYAIIPYETGFGTLHSIGLQYNF